MKTNEGFIIICALRYSLGRRSYAPDLVTTFIKDNWSRLDTNTKLSIKTDVNEAINNYNYNKLNNIDINNLGDECDVKTWFDFHDWLNGFNYND